MKLKEDMVSASEIASWAWCPESWRLSALGAEPENRAAMKRGERRHARVALFERWSRKAISLGWWLLALAVCLLALAVGLWRMGR